MHPAHGDDAVRPCVECGPVPEAVRPGPTRPVPAEVLVDAGRAAVAVIGVRVEVRLPVRDVQRLAATAGNAPMTRGAPDQLLYVPGSFAPVDGTDPARNLSIDGAPSGRVRRGDRDDQKQD